MKIKFPFGILVMGVVLGLATVSWAGMVGAPVKDAEVENTPRWDLKRFHFGFEGDWIFEKELKVSGGTRAEADLIQQLLGRVDYQLLDAVALYGLFGAVDLGLEATRSVNNEKISEDFQFGFARGGGIRAVWEIEPSLPSIPHLNAWTWGVDGRFLNWSNDLDKWTGSASGSFSNTTGRVTAQEFHLGVTAGPRLDFDTWYLVPYLGGRWSQLTLDENDLDSDQTTGDDIVDSDWRADDHVGLVLGLNARVQESGGVGIELHLVDETAFSVEGRFHF